MPDGQYGGQMTSTHPEKEDCPWVIAVVDHPQRTDSPAYTRSRALMQRLIGTTKGWVLSGDQYQDHHGGSVWVKDAAGWLVLQVPVRDGLVGPFFAAPPQGVTLR